jgi:predicted membrane protein
MHVGKSMILGVLFVLIGGSILLKAVFHIDIPLARMAVALFIIYIGVKMLMSSFGVRGACDWDRNGAALFNSKSFKWTEGDKDSKQYSVVFGSSSIDLSSLPSDKKEDTHVEVNTVFGEGTVLLSKKIPFQIQTNAVFAEAKMPDDNMVAFGTLNYTNPDQKAETGRLIIHGNVVFGSLKFKYKD